MIIDGDVPDKCVVVGAAAHNEAVISIVNRYVPEEGASVAVIIEAVIVIAVGQIPLYEITCVAGTGKVEAVTIIDLGPVVYKGG